MSAKIKLYSSQVSLSYQPRSMLNRKLETSTFHFLHSFGLRPGQYMYRQISFQSAFVIHIAIPFSSVLTALLSNHLSGGKCQSILLK